MTVTGLPSVRRSMSSSDWGAASHCLEDSYDVSPRELGEGGFGSVRRAWHKGVKEVTRAVKMVKKTNPKVEALVRREVNILRTLDHPNICRLYETFEGRRSVCMVLEYVDGEELFEYIQEVAAAVEAGQPCDCHALAGTVGCQLLSALQYCHERGVVHRDLKPENIMVKRLSPNSWDSLQVKLIDFGLATMLDQHGSSSGTTPKGSLVGTFEYLAPEVRLGPVVADPAADQWSVGVVLHALLTGSIPAEHVRLGKTLVDMEHSTYTRLSKDAKALIVDLLRVNPKQRLSAAEALDSPFMRSYRWRRGSEIILNKTDNITLGKEQPVLKVSQRRAEEVASKAVAELYCGAMRRRSTLAATLEKLSASQEAALHERFKHAAKDCEGCINTRELGTWLTETGELGWTATQALMDSICESFDNDKTDGAAEDVGRSRADLELYADRPIGFEDFKLLLLHSTTEEGGTVRNFLTGSTEALSDDEGCSPLEEDSDSSDGERKGLVPSLSLPLQITVADGGSGDKEKLTCISL